MKTIFKLCLIVLSTISLKTFAQSDVKDALFCHDFKVLPLSQAKVTTYNFKKEVVLNIDYDGVYLFDDKLSLEERRLNTIKALEEYSLDEVIDKEAYNHIKRFTKTDEDFKNLYKEILINYWVIDAISGNPHKLKKCNYSYGVNTFMYAYYISSTVNSSPIFKAIIANTDVIYFNDI